MTEPDPPIEETKKPEPAAKLIGGACGTIVLAWIVVLLVAVLFGVAAAVGSAAFRWTLESLGW